MEKQNKLNSSVTNSLVLISVLIVATVFLLSSKNPSSPDTSTFKPFESPFGSKNFVERDDLDAALEKASTENKTVIIAMLNGAYVEAQGDDPMNMMDLFLEGFWVGEETRSLINNLLMVATDQKAYARCVFRGLHCYLLLNETEGSDMGGEMVYKSKGYVNMTWRKVLFCLRVLRKGYSFIFTDTDMVWLRNPFTRLSNTPTDELQLSTDEFNGDPRSERNSVNTGFYFVRSNSRTISLFERWCAMRKNFTRLSDQAVLNDLIHGGVLKELNVTTLFLETRYFHGFCQGSKDMNNAVIVHAACCRYISAKVNDLMQVLRDWKKFKGLPKNETSSMVWSEHNNCYRAFHKRH